jgi:type IV secretion system protein VirB6
VLNAVVLTWFAFFALGLSAFVGHHLFTAIQAGGGFLGSTLNVLGESTRYCVLMILMAILCFQAPGLAAALTGGAAIHHGVHWVYSAGVPSGWRSRNGASAAGSGGRAGTGWPYAVGAAAGTAARNAGAAPPGGVVRTAAASGERRPDVPRAAAYRRAADNGRA